MNFADVLSLISRQVTAACKIERVVMPALAGRRCAVVDRYVTTAVALDGFGAEIGAEEIFDLYSHLPIPEVSFLVAASTGYRTQRLADKGLTSSDGRWFMDIEHEEECYERAALFLESRGWRFRRLSRPLETVSDADHLAIAAKICASIQ